MKFSILFAATILAISSISAQAEVLVYSGTVRLTDLDTRRKPFVRKAFLVADPETGSTRLVTYGKVGRIKTREAEAERIAHYFNGALGVTGPLLDIYSYAEKQEEPIQTRESLFLRGYQKSLQVSSDQGNPVKKQRAKFLKGSSRVFLGDTSASYIERELSLAFDRDRTLEVNIAGKTAAAVFDEIVLFLDAKGYSD